jgi:hypothetical protein
MKTTRTLCVRLGGTSISIAAGLLLAACATTGGTGTNATTTGGDRNTTVQSGG